MDSKETKAQLVDRVIELDRRISWVARFPVPTRWLNTDLTITQLKVLLVLEMQGPIRMGVLASCLGISIKNATGIVKRLVERHLVARDDDSKDRRVVLCRLTDQGQKLVQSLDELGSPYLSAIRNLFQKKNSKELERLIEALETAERHFTEAAVTISRDSIEPKG